MAFENPAVYTEVDPSGQLSYLGNKFIFTGLSRDADTYFWKNVSISGDFEFKFKIQGTSGDTAGLSQHLTLANALNDYNGLLNDAGENAICCALRDEDAGVLMLRIYEVDGTTLYSDTYLGTSATDYWCKFRRVGSTLYKLIYTDEFITLVDTLTLALHNVDTFTILYPIQSWNNGTTQTLTGYIEDIDLGLIQTQILRRRIEGY